MQSKDEDFSQRFEAAHVAVEPRMLRLFIKSLRIPSVSGDEASFVRFIRDFAVESGLTADLWETDESDLAAYPVAQSRHLPLAGRPTLVISLPSSGSGRSMLFNAHSDVVSPGPIENWKFGPWSGTQAGDRIYGRGACDVKGPLISALWAMLALKQASPDGLPGGIALELVPGEEDCVTLGTLTSVARGHTADACIVLEPTECLPRNASRPGLRFDITCLGKAVHGTVKWQGQDAIELARRVMDRLKELESRWNNDRGADPLFASYPIARPITVDFVQGGQWQGMVCDQCRVAGYFELLPSDEPEAWMHRLEMEVHGLLDPASVNDRNIIVRFPEQYSGHSLRQENSLCINAERSLKVSVDVLDADSLKWAGWSGFNSGCEAGLRANLLQTPTLVWGPGSLAQAHAADEYIHWAEIRTVAKLFGRFSFAWTNNKE